MPSVSSQVNVLRFEESFCLDYEIVLQERLKQRTMNSYLL